MNTAYWEKLNIFTNLSPLVLQLWYTGLYTCVNIKFMFINKLSTALLQNKAFDYMAVIHKPNLNH